MAIEGVLLIGVVYLLVHTGSVYLSNRSADVDEDDADPLVTFHRSLTDLPPRAGGTRSSTAPTTVTCPTCGVENEHG